MVAPLADNFFLDAMDVFGKIAGRCYILSSFQDKLMEVITY